MHCTVTANTSGPFRPQELLSQRSAIRLDSEMCWSRTFDWQPNSREMISRNRFLNRCLIFIDLRIETGRTCNQELKEMCALLLLPVRVLQVSFAARTEMLSAPALIPRIRKRKNSAANSLRSSKFVELAEVRPPNRLCGGFRESDANSQFALPSTA